MGNVSKRVKIWKVLLIEVFLLVGFLTKLCLYMSPDSHMKYPLKDLSLLLQAVRVSLEGGTIQGNLTRG